MSAKLLFVHALSPLHAGTGQGVGVIDLPIAREKATDLPYLPGSSLKGSLRDLAERKDSETCWKVFGPDTLKADEYAGAAQFSDQRLLLLPVRSLKGTFAWVTSPYLLRRFLRDAQETAVKNETDLPQSVPEPTSLEQCLVVSEACALQSQEGDEQKVYLEELDLTAINDAQAKAWAVKLATWIFPGPPADTPWQGMLIARFCIIHDDTLNFLLQTATEVTARIKIMDSTKTVEKGGLWYEEALPTETILSGLVVATPVSKTNLSEDEIHQHIGGLLDQTIQFGGNATVGRGICRVRLV